MKWVGAHVSTAGGVYNAPINAERIGAKAFALFTKNQRQWNTPPLIPSSIVTFKEQMDLCGFTPSQVLPHGSYLINLGNPDMEARTRSIQSFIMEMQRCNELGLLYLNTHPGSSLGKITLEGCLDLIVDSVNDILEKTEKVTVVLENTAGQGGWVGFRFEQLASIIEKIHDKSRIGVCFDTAHAFAAGYDLRTRQACKETFDLFERIIGKGYLKGMHLNDSKADLGSKIDRHENLGCGKLGLEVFRFIMTHPLFDHMPLILETIDEARWPREIQLLYTFGKGQ